MFRAVYRKSHTRQLNAKQKKQKRKPVNYRKLKAIAKIAASVAVGLKTLYEIFKLWR